MIQATGDIETHWTFDFCNDISRGLEAKCGTTNLQRRKVTQCSVDLVEELNC